MSAKKTDAKDADLRIVCVNRRARHDFSIDEVFEAGLVLEGSEVKSLRASAVQLKDSYGLVENGEVFLVGCHISPYEKGSFFNHAPERKRKLLLNAREIKRITIRVEQRGHTLVPLRIYFRKHLAKVEIALCKGKAEIDRRDDIRKRELDREMEREHARKR